ncbi:glycolate oxidase subunit GlcE [Rhodalgimonas zhirmunskyi]|uniref:Glycolate oxidase subunit GlcE n=1 Tax=Rhodalgimonas zhirmunskyi TaxID=2964767 RepID=A0AAJ1X511_9RHOB|nr:glycolate oxidase subunit GlcE [Rhodoalgimonas zhirmunskyi]MDQ2094086.1 glycolate oxidase subunit GlcE [Rhodoalgimonas zhirmunskyi]
MTEEELSEAIAGATGPLRILGGGTRPIGRPVDGALLSTAALSGIVDYEPGALTLVAKAGTPVAEIETALAAEGQRLPFEPMDHRGLLGTQGTPTIGGIVAANVSGPRRIQVGACRDFLLGVRFVDGRGRVLKNGGRVMKNVTGYDLVKLMAGSRGTLGVLSEVSLKVLPRPAETATLRFTGLNEESAIKAVTAALGSPFEVTGAAHMQGATLLRLEGFGESVRYRARALQDLLASFGKAEVLPDEIETWQALRDVAPYHSRTGDVWLYSVTPTEAPALAGQLRGHGALDVIFDWGGGRLWVLAPEGQDMRQTNLRGHATLIRASKETRRRLPVFQPEPVPIQKISQDLRAKFDPRGILNPGLMEHIP